MRAIFLVSPAQSRSLSPVLPEPNTPVYASPLRLTGLCQFTESRKSISSPGVEEVVLAKSFLPPAQATAILHQSLRKLSSIHLWGACWSMGTCTTDMSRTGQGALAATFLRRPRTNSCKAHPKEVSAMEVNAARPRHLLLATPTTTQCNATQHNIIDTRNTKGICSILTVLRTFSRLLLSWRAVGRPAPH
jgi:hypothetical protein